MILRLRINEQDQEALDFLERELTQSTASIEGMRKAQVVIAILRWTSSPSFSLTLAKVATGTLAAPEGNPKEESEAYWLRWNAAEALMLLGEGATGGVPTVIDHVEEFRSAISMASGSNELAELSQRYQSGKVLRVLIDALANAPTPESEIALRNVLDIGEEKLRYFPFLYADVKRALDPAN